MKPTTFVLMLGSVLSGCSGEDFSLHSTPANDDGAAADPASSGGGPRGAQEAGTSAPLRGPMPDVMLAYATATGGLGVRGGSSAGTWSAETMGAQVPGARFVVPRVSPMRDEAIVGVLSGGGLAVFDALATELAPAWTAPKASGAAAGHRGFDVAFESGSGTALAVYADGSATPRIRKRARDGAWSADAPAWSSPPGSAAVAWVTLVPHPVSNEITLLYSDDNRTLFASTWSGGELGSPVTLSTSPLSTLDWSSFAGAYESTSGELVVVWGQKGAVQPGTVFARRAASASSFTAPAVMLPSMPAGPIALAADPSSDKIAMSALEYTCNGGTCDDFFVGIWTGDNWGSSTGSLDGNVTTSFGTHVGANPVSVAWVGSPAVAIAAYHRSDSAKSFLWTRWAGTSWSPPADALPSAKIGTRVSIDLVSSSSDLFAIVADEAGCLWAKRYDGVRWADTEGGAALEAALPLASGTPFGAFAR